MQHYKRSTQSKHRHKTNSVVNASDTTKAKKGELHKDALRPTKLASRHFTFPVALLMRSDICVSVARLSSN